MATQISLRVSKGFLSTAKSYAKTHGFLSIQELMREAVREKIYEEKEVSASYLKKLKSKEANTFLTQKESDEFEKEIAERAKIE